MLKALLAILYERANADSDSDLKRSIRPGRGYGEYLYQRRGEERPTEEQKWYDLLKEQDGEVVYWWKRFGLQENTAIFSELKQLSKETPGTRTEGITSLQEGVPHHL